MERQERCPLALDVLNLNQKVISEVKSSKEKKHLFKDIFIGKAENRKVIIGGSSRLIYWTNMQDCQSCLCYCDWVSIKDG